MSNHTVSYFAVVPAAGSGQRFGSELPKQYLPIRGKPVLRHTLELLHSIDWLQEIVLVHALADKRVDDELLSGLERVSTCVGGASRCESVLRGLESLQADDNDWVLVHDAVRPCVSPADILALRQSLQDGGDAGILALPVRDTLKLVKNDVITQTASRKDLWQAMTPQQARIGQLKSALASQINNPAVTDEASALEAEGIQVRVVTGRPDNIKITYPEDLDLAVAILAGRDREN